MKYLIVGDVHWSKVSSILKANGKKFTQRLENLIDTITWCEKTADENGCSEIIYLGDFFDRPDINSYEASALKHVKWSSLKHHFIVGNHESPVMSLSVNSTDVLDSPNFDIESKVRRYETPNSVFYFLPYIVEDERKHLVEYLNRDEKKPIIIFSHNDLKGINYGRYESQEGFDLKEIEENCDLFINGHLHNGSFLNKGKTILNLGNITGQNFGEDAFNYSHKVCILDDESLELTFVENPHAFNFYKFDIEKKIDFHTLDLLKDNAVVQIRCLDTLLDELKQKLTKYPNIVESRVLIFRQVESAEESETFTFESSDYLEQFSSFILEKLGNSEIVKNEVLEVCK